MKSFFTLRWQLEASSHDVPESTANARARSGWHAALLTLTALLVLGASTGCGNTLYLVKVNEAEEDLHEAQEIGAEQYAPYEFYSADARLKEAKKQAAQAEYGNASQLSNEASAFALSAIKKTKEQRDSRGAPPQRTGADQ